MEKFSVLMSVYAREQGEYLREALRSIFEQTLLPVEVVLVEDGPLNEGLYSVINEFVRKYKELKVIPLSQNVGLGRALNIGLENCSNELVARMDSDDISLPQRFELQLQAFNENPQLAIVGGWISEFENSPDCIIAYRKVPRTDKELKKYYQKRNPFNHMTVMFRKSDVLKVGGYQHFYLLEDYWLWVRMIKNGAQVYNIQRVLVNARGGAGMAARRGGWKYVKSEMQFQWRIWRIDAISIFTFCKNVSIRFSVHIMPDIFRNFIYKKMLR